MTVRLSAPRRSVVRPSVKGSLTRIPVSGIAFSEAGTWASATVAGPDQSARVSAGQNDFIRNLAAPRSATLDSQDFHPGLSETPIWRKYLQMIAQGTSSDKRRRDKPILSCAFCRGRKLRCNRQSPCNACLRRGKPEECIYSTSEQERKDAIDYRPHAKGQTARQRITRLESLVTEMRGMAQGPSQTFDKTSSPSEALNSPGSPSAPVDNMGKLSLTESHAVYTGSSHWATILDDIQHLKDELSDDYSDGVKSSESTPFDTNSTHSSPTTRISLLTSATCFPREQIISTLPSRRVVDRHVSQFFNAFDFAPVILHRNQFLAEYANFWKDPSTVPIMWIGLLYSIMSISVFLQDHHIGALGMSPAETYRTLTIHCLIAGDYLQSSRYTIETLTLHFAVDQNVNLDTYIGNWVLIGVVIRISMRMGLHRDPSHWSNIQPLQAEFRRRIWMTLYDMDFFTSTQIGLPRIIKDSQCDTHLPTHLLDDDIGLDHGEVPQGRPLTDPSSLSYIIQRHSIIKVAAEIYDATEAGPPSPATIAALNIKLENAVDAIPAWLKYRSLEISIADNPVTILHRMVLDILIHKAVYLLHRRSFVKASTGEESIKSNEACIKAALAIMEHQRRMDEETQAGGLMFGIRWKVATSLNHEFLQATIMLCLALTRKSDILEALSVAKGLWEKNADQSVEAQRAVNAITAVLNQNADRPSTPSTLVASSGLFQQMPGAADCLGSFNYEQDMALDPSLFSVDDDMVAFGSMLDDWMPAAGEDNPRVG
ncbi:Oleate activated transcription factor 3 [Fusarium albosuccineum]|uniref:Oleate activated transcription factor 3 n=1 Tax=Fusarium albosuccineum TaxID=1237068 RepID=A0A8H4PDX7_9HYPO|nr:Oleate activated transcription factor 3 [Fusarium albosuccineum]